MIAMIATVLLAGLLLMFLGWLGQPGFEKGALMIPDETLAEPSAAEEPTHICEACKTLFVREEDCWICPKPGCGSEDIFRYGPCSVCGEEGPLNDIMDICGECEEKGEEAATPGKRPWRL